MQEGRCARVCTRTGKHRADTSLSVVLMVPLTTQQLLHIDVVLALGLKHTHTHTIGLAHAHPEVSCHDKKNQLVSVPLLPDSLYLLFFYDGRINIWFMQTNTHPTVHTASSPAHFPASPMCVSPPIMSVLRHLLAY